MLKKFAFWLICYGLSQVPNLIGWTFACSSYGAGSITQERLTEKNLVQYGKVYANKMQVVYDVLIKYADDDFYHVVSILDEFLIPVEYQNQNETEKIEKNSETLISIF